MYFKNIINGYILSLSTGCGQVRITRQEYNELLEIIRNKPADPDGYMYMLRNDTRQWELVERPPEPDPEPDPDAEAADYEQALMDLGVRIE